MAVPRRVAHAQTQELADLRGASRALPWLLALLCLAGSALVAGRVAEGDGRLGTLALYLASLVGYLWLLGLRGVPRVRPSRSWLLPAGVAAAQLAAAAFFASAPAHFHYDEFITAYASLTLGPIGQIDWFAAYPPSGWVAKFPIPFFALQAPMLHLLGPSVEAVRISTWPY